MIIPVITEKTTELAKQGKYTFKMDQSVSKNQAREIIERIFGVNVVSVWTIKTQGEIKRGLSRRKRIIKPSKKVMVTLKDKQSIDLFESKKKK